MWSVQIADSKGKLFSGKYINAFTKEGVSKKSDNQLFDFPTTATMSDGCDSSTADARCFRRPLLARFGHSHPKTKKPPLRQLRKLLIINMLMAEPTGLEPATSNVTGQNSAFRIWLKYRQNWHLEKHQQLRFGIVALFIRSFLGTFWATFSN